MFRALSLNQLTTPNKDWRVSSPMNSPSSPGHLLINSPSSPGHPISLSLTSLIPKNNSVTFTPQQVFTSSVAQGIKNLDATPRKIEEDKNIDERKLEDNDIMKYMKTRFDEIDENTKSMKTRFDEIDEKFEVAFSREDFRRSNSKSTQTNGSSECSFTAILEQHINHSFTDDDDFQTTMNNLKQIRTTIKSETTIEHIYQIFLRKSQLEEADSKRHYWCLICNSRIPVPRDMRKNETGCFRVYICRSDDGKPCMERKSGKWEKRWSVLMSKQADPLEEITEKLYQTIITEKSDEEDKENEARNFIDEEGDEEMTANDNDDAFWTPAAMSPRPEILSKSKAIGMTQHSWDDSTL